MRGAVYWAVIAAVAVTEAAAPAPVHAAAKVSSADRARIARLVYQSQSARQADLRRGDAATRDLRYKADSAERLASLTRVELAKARAEGAKAKKQAQALEAKLEEQERSLAEIAERYAAELAKRDEDYARERSVLVSTGERLLRTPEGRRILDLYNAGGEANWKEAKAVMDEARRARRALDTRDAAVMYSQARAKGLEATGAVIAMYEELLRDDPSEANDWLFVSILYRESGASAKSLEAAQMAARLATGDLAQSRVLIEVARAHRANDDISAALAALAQAETASRAALASSPSSLWRHHLLADVLTQRGSVLLEKAEWSAAREAYHEAVGLYENLLTRTGKWPVKEMYLGALLGLAYTHWNEEDVAGAAPHIRRAHAFATEALRKHPRLTEAREKVALTSAWTGDLFLSQWKYEAALRMYEQGGKLFGELTAEDPGLTWYDPNLEYLSRASGSAQFEVNRPERALSHLEQSEKIARKYSSPVYLVALQSGLRHQGVALAALGRNQEAERRRAEALRIGQGMIDRDSAGHGRWARLEQSNVLLDMANDLVGTREAARGLELVAQAEPLIRSLRQTLPVASRAVGMTGARLKAELTFALGDIAASTRIYEEALAQSESVASDPGARIELRFGRADLLLSSAKQLLARGERQAAIERLRQAHSVFAVLSGESDSAQVHQKHAEAAWLMADNQVDQMSWDAVAGQLQQLRDRHYANEHSDRLLAEAKARSVGQRSSPLAQ
jgi:tetratricopeptide (TPR) repeat protein